MESNFRRNNSDNRNNGQQQVEQKRDNQDFSINPPRKPETSDMTALREGFSGGVIKKETK